MLNNTGQDRRVRLYIVIFVCVLGLAACSSSQPIATPVNPLLAPADNNGPIIERITTSGQQFAISDCIPDSITVTAKISDPSGVGHVMLWYRVGDNQPFNPVEAGYLGDGTYARTVKGTDMLGSDYGVWEFYLTAEDGVGNKSQSPVDTSVQLLPCVG